METKTSQQLRDDIAYKSKWVDTLGFFLRLITLIGVVASIFFILNAIDETKHQGEINQKYIRCIVLLPATTYQNSPEARAKAVDKCAMESKLPNANTR